MYFHCIEFTDRHADAAACAGVGIDDVQFVFFTGDAFRRAVAGADHAAGAVVVDDIGDQRLADTSGTGFIL